MEYSIVELTPDDWQRYKTIRLDSLEHDPQAFGSNYKREAAFKEEKWKSRLQPYSEEYKQWAVFAEDKIGNLVGSVGAYVPEDGIAEIVGVYVSEEARGKDVASILMKEMIEKLKSSGVVNIIRLSVNKEQLGAVALYKKFDFIVTGEKKETLGDGEEHIELLMEIDLTK